MTPLCPTQPREYLYRHGVNSLSLAQATTLIIGTGTAGKPVSELGRQAAEALLSGSSTVQELEKLPGLGPAKASALVAALALPNLLQPPQLTNFMTTPEAVFQACSDLLSEQQEHLVAFFLNVRQGKIRRELITIGTATASIAHAREVFRAAIIHNAHSLVLAHNHPSGDPQPSSADCEVTKCMAEAGKAVGIELLDHVICAQNGWCSLRERLPGLFS